MSLMQRLMAQRLAKAAAPEQSAVDVESAPASRPQRVEARRAPESPLQHRHRLRAEFDGVELVSGLQPPVFLSETQPAPVPTSAPVARGSCKAINADTGRQCALPGGHAGEHRHGRTAFTRVATPGQTSFARRDALEAAATSRLSSPFTTS